MVDCRVASVQLKELRRLGKSMRLAADDWKTPWQTLFAIIMSARTRDETTIVVGERLFKKYPSLEALARADFSSVANIVRPVNFFRNKTKNILGSAKMLRLYKNGEPPHSLEELVKLPGVGRKTANVVLGNAFGRPHGIAVDTHVQRLAQRLGLTTETTPDKIEQDLLALVRRKDWTLFSHLLISHGRTVCKARVPQCAACPVYHLCPSTRSEGPG